MSENRRRLSYLLRLWQAEQEGTWVWRASLESASDRFGRPGERRGFASLADLYAFLVEETTTVDKRQPRSLKDKHAGTKPKTLPGAEEETS